MMNAGEAIKLLYKKLEYLLCEIRGGRIKGSFQVGGYIETKSSVYAFAKTD